MEQLAYKRQKSIAVEEYGYIIERQGDAHVVVTGSGRYVASRAISCLIEPQQGDKVLISIGFDDKVYILSILERSSGDAYDIKSDRDLNLTSIGGAIRIGAQDGVELTSGKDMDLFAPKVKISGNRGEVRFNRLHYWGQLVDASVERIKSVSQVFETVSERLVQSVKTCYRTITDAEHVKAGNVYYAVRRLFSMRGKYTMVSAKKDVKIDGRHIHMG